MNATTELEGSAALTHWGVIRARGADAASFLHGQLTSDVQGLDAGHARLAGFCSAKGRLQASFIVWRAGPQDFLLACSRSVLPAVLKRLSMFVLRAKCTLSDATGDVPLYGLAGEPARALASTLAPWQCTEAAGASVIRLPDSQGTARAWWAGANPPTATALPLERWQWLEVCSGVPTIEAATVEAFVPQMINFELVGGVDFKKGCYPGQEVVARSQYRGTIKRRMSLFDVAAAASAGQEVFHSGDATQPAGMVVNAAPWPDGHGSSLLVEVKLAALAEGSLHLASVDGPVLTRQALPYAVPLEAAEAA
jgi:folate-binding protein YgfZ